MYHEIVPRTQIPRVGRPVDVYQRYADLLPRRLFVEADAFEAQMRFLKQSDVHTLTLSKVRDFYDSGTPLPPRSVLLTFDDLYQSVRERAYPVLQELGFHAVGFVVHDWVFPEPQPLAEELSRTLSWPELESMRDVFEYANHSAALHTRGEHGTGVERAPRDLLVRDAARAAHRLDAPSVYAYPFGSYTDQTVRWLAEVGMSLAFTTKPGYNTETTPRLELHRDGVFADTTMDELESYFEAPPGMENVDE